MYIKNINKFPNAELFKTNKIIADWLVMHKIPLLSISGKDFIFSCTAELEIALTKLPFYLKPLLKTPKCFK
jgi:hypothetical protein